MPRNYSQRDLKILFARSRNVCAFPGCENQIVVGATAFDPDAAVGRVAHIVASGARGPRADPNYPADDLDREPNLIVLCAHHHALIDAQESTYTVEQLRRWKGEQGDNPPTPESLSAEAHAGADDLRYDASAEKYERAARLADSRDDSAFQAKALLNAARSWTGHLMDGPGPPDLADPLLSRIESHLVTADSLGASLAELAVQRALLALLRQDPQAMLDHAVDALESDDAVADDRASALHLRLQALRMLGRTEDAVFLCGDDELAPLCDEASGAAWFNLRLERVRVLAAGKALSADELHRFVRDVRTRVGTEGFPLAVELAVMLGELGSYLNSEDYFDEASTTGAAGYEIAQMQTDTELTISLALQTAELAAQADNEAEARRFLGHAESTVSEIDDPSSAATVRALTLFTRGRVLTELAGREGLDNQSAQKLFLDAQGALAEAAEFVSARRENLGGRGGVELFLADIEYWRGQVAGSLGRPAEAVTHLQAARSDAAMANPRFAREAGMRAWLLESKALREGDSPEAAHKVLGDLLATLDGFSDQELATPPLEEVTKQARGFYKYLGDTELPLLEWLRSPAAQAIGLMARQSSLREAVAEQVAPLVAWWKEWYRHGNDPTAEFIKDIWRQQKGYHEDVYPAAGIDFWGRGGFSRVAAAIRAQPHRAVAVDARSVDEVRRWARVLCPLFDTVVVKWKGSLGVGQVVAPQFVRPETRHPPSGTAPARIDRDSAFPAFGGHGYGMTLGRPPAGGGWQQAVSHGNPLPPELAAFLLSEALQLVRAGRLVVLPAPLVGCTQSAVGWTDDLLVNSVLGGAVTVIGSDPTHERVEGSAGRVLDVSSLALPFIDAVPLPDLASVLDETDEWLAPLRSRILGAVRAEDLRYERWDGIVAVEDDIRRACAELEERLQSIAGGRREDGWVVSEVDAAVSAGERVDEPDSVATDPITTMLRSLASVSRDVAPWVPYWRLTGMGGNLRWTCPLDNRSVPKQSADDDAGDSDRQRVVQTWLYPGTVGWGYLVARKRSAPDS